MSCTGSPKIPGISHMCCSTKVTMKKSIPTPHIVTYTGRSQNRFPATRKKFHA